MLCPAASSHGAGQTCAFIFYCAIYMVYFTTLPVTFSPVTFPQIQSPPAVFHHICDPTTSLASLLVHVFPAQSHSTTTYNMEKAASGSITLSNGVIMPTVGIGTYQASGSTLYDCLTAAIVQGGVRHIDTARIYKVGV